MRGWWARYREAAAFLPEVMAEPERIKRWLLEARRAQLVAVGLVLFGLFVMPPLRDAALQAVFRPRVSSGFLGIGRRVHRHPMLGPARVSLTTVYWLGAAAAVGALFWLRLPLAAAGSSGGRSRRRTPREPGGAPALATAATVVGPAGAGSGATGGDAAPAGAAGPAGAELGPGDSAGRYTLVDELGRGGMGVVYRARDPMLGREVALKQLFPEMQRHAELAARFRREAQVLARLTHRHVVQIHDLVIDDSGMWMAMELITGGSLADRLEKEGALPYDEIRVLGLQMAEALAHAHAQGVVHRDFKPGNVMLTAEREVKVADFGLAGLGEQEGAPKLTRPGAMMGSPAYMSPEQITGGSVDARTDVYALGVTLYEMAAGRPPFEGTTTSVLTQHLSVAPALPPPAPRALPPRFVALLEHMLAKAAAERTPDMTEVIEALSG